MNRYGVVRAVLILLTAASVGPASAQGAAKPAAEVNQASNAGEYRIGPDDVLQISIWKNEPMSRTVSVRPDGMISLPLLNDVQAAGLTPMGLRQELMKRLAEYEPNPEVSVIVTEVKSFKVSVIGEVAKPGRFELKGRTTVLDVVAQAGGFKDFASRTRIVVLRPNGSAMKRIPFNYNRVVSTDSEQENLLLEPGDIVVVP